MIESYIWAWISGRLALLIPQTKSGSILRKSSLYQRVGEPTLKDWKICGPGVSVGMRREPIALLGAQYAEFHSASQLFRESGALKFVPRMRDVRHVTPALKSDMAQNPRVVAKAGISR